MELGVIGLQNSRGLGGGCGRLCSGAPKVLPTWRCPSSSTELSLGHQGQAQGPGCAPT